MKTLLLRLEPIIWLLFGAGIMVGTLLLPGYLLTIGLGGPLGFLADGALSFDRAHTIFSNPLGRLVLPKGLSTSPLPDRPDTVAFLDGPTVLAALTSEAVTLAGDAPDAILVSDDEREWSNWLGGYRTVHQSHNLRLVPLNTITDQAYTVYFPLQQRGRG